MVRRDEFQARVVERLLAERTGAGIWEGELSSSALSTATAVIALALAGREGPGSQELVRRGLDWLARTQNPDGGWGDTTESPSNISTAILCWVALGIDVECAAHHRATVERVEAYLRGEAGELTPAALARAVRRVYGEDRTFAVPILMAAAVGGRFGDGPGAWSEIPPLPFEVAALPRRLFPALGLPMVSYAMPALIAVGQVIHHHSPGWNPITRAARSLARARTLRVLQAIQPSTGGFLEATPLTSFVVMSLVACGEGEHPVVRAGLEFLRASARDDGSWPIDTNLTTWVTTLAVNALASGGRLDELTTEDERAAIRGWLLAQQLREEHPYTGAAPGAWCWTDLAGGVPDADDTAGALLALAHLGGDGSRADAGTGWLRDLQNRDGGIPTFCRGWGKLPFDRSTADLTAHALRAWEAWPDAAGVDRARTRAVRFLVDAQRSDGAWVPLWFGNQHEPGLENPLYGTSRVVRALAGVEDAAGGRALQRGVEWILAAQRDDGGWGGGPCLPATIEETALAVDALADERQAAARGEALTGAVARGVDWLARRTDGGERFAASPIGLYFARLWYSERLYPLVFTAAALERARVVLDGAPAVVATAAPGTPAGAGARAEGGR